MGSVSPDLLQKTARAHLDAENMFIVVVGEAKDIQAALREFGTVTVYDNELRPRP